jgi:hypothetical protein
LPIYEKQAKKRKKLGKAVHTQYFGEVGQALDLVLCDINICNPTYKTHLFNLPFPQKAELI